MKLLTVTVPCYNSAAYMSRCIDSLLTGGEEMDILLIDDGSKDDTGAIADRYAQEHPTIIRVIHQENGGHGEGLNQGIRHAQGVYFKVVDSDDRLDVHALPKLLNVLRAHAADDQIDLLVHDYCYDHAEQDAAFTIHYRNVMKPGRMLTWDDTRHFPLRTQFMIHSLVYRTQLLRDMNLVLPRHTFYEDNLYIYRPLPYCKRLYYLDETLYGYFVGRGDQSINEGVILRRLDQVTAIAIQMITSYSLDTLNALPRHLRDYMINNMAGQLSTTSALQFIADTDASLAMNRDMWRQIHDFDPALYKRLRRNLLGRATVLPGRTGRRMLVCGYRIGRKLISF